MRIFQNLNVSARQLIWLHTEYALALRTRHVLHSGEQTQFLLSYHTAQQTT